MASEKGRPVLDALVHELAEQGQPGFASGDLARLTAYPIKGTIDVIALAAAVENAIGGGAADSDGKTADELNAANDG
jgi:hypothetical protein